MKRSNPLPTDDVSANSLTQPLLDDVNACKRLLTESDTQFARRMLVRATFAYTEGFLYHFKGVVSAGLMAKGITEELDLAKTMLLLDTRPRASALGEIEFEDNRMSFLTHCAFILRTAADLWNVDPTPFFGGNGWAEMQKALKVRHRITHPKAPEQLEITDCELESVTKAHNWLFRCATAIFEDKPNT